MLPYLDIVLMVLKDS